MAKENIVEKPTDYLWINDPYLRRDFDPDWQDKVDLIAFPDCMRRGQTPDKAWIDKDRIPLYIAYLKKHNSPLADGY